MPRRPHPIWLALVLPCACSDAAPSPSGSAPPPASHAGPCTDADPPNYRIYPEDADGDGYYRSGSEGICGERGAPPEGALRGGAGMPDCDDDDPNVAVGYFPDGDGDGFPGGAERTVCGPPGAAPEGATDRVSLDCDDGDPTIAVLYYVDADDDGYADSHPKSVCGAPDEAPGGAVAAPLGMDCDAADATRNTLQYRDVDGDGYGTDAEECLGSELVDGHSFRSGDCDEENAAVHPNAVELWDDEVDSNCDGFSTPPVNCWDDSSGAYFPCDELLPTDAACAAADLSIVGADGMENCREGGHSWTVLVANLGTVTVPGFVLHFVDDGRSERDVSIADTLAPGVQRAYYVPAIAPDPISIQATSSVPDCRSANDALSAGADWVQCH